MNLVVTLLLTATGLTAIPPPVVTNARQIAEEQLYGRPIRVVGHVQGVYRDTADEQYNFLVVACGETRLYGGVWSTNRLDALRALQRFVGCEIEVPCICRKRFGRHQRKALGQELDDIDPRTIRILKPPGQSVFDAPELQRDNLSIETLASAGPRRILGRVVARWQDDSMLIRTGAGDAIVVTLCLPELPDLHETVEVVGIPETDLYGFSLSQARWRKTRTGTPSVHASRATTLTLKDFLYHHNRYSISSAHHGTVIRLRGIVKERSHTDNGSARLRLGDGDLSLSVDCTALPKAFERLEEGSRIQVTGVFVLLCDAWRPDAPFPKTREMLLVPRTEGDIVVLSRPPWWTPVRFWTFIGLLGGLLIAILLWNRSLRRLANRRLRELARRQTQAIRAKLKIQERTRLAADLHDAISQNLTGVSLELRTLDTFAKDLPADAAVHLSAARQALGSCRRELRNVLWDLRNDALDRHSFEEALQLSLEPHRGTAHLAVRFPVSRQLLNDHLAHTVIQIVRELVSNAVRHGEASDIRVAGVIDSGRLLFSVSDDGIGFDPSACPGVREGHFGLTGVNERIENEHGQITVNSSPGRGTRVSVTLPLDIQP